MSAFYEEMAGVALDLISEFGQPITLRDEVPGGYDPETGIVADPVIAEQTGSGILQDYTLSERAGISNHPGSLIQQGDKKLIMSASGLTMPTLTTKAVVGGHTWAIVNIKEINPAGTPLIYELQARR
jgi:hypothetical protein